MNLFLLWKYLCISTLTGTFFQVTYSGVAVAQSRVTALNFM